MIPFSPSLSRSLCLSLFVPIPPTPHPTLNFAGVGQGQEYDSVLFSSAFSQCSALGVLPRGFFLHWESCNKSKYRSAKNDVKLGKHIINCYSLASGWLGDLVNGLRSFPIKVSGRNLVQSGNNHKVFPGLQEFNEFVSQLLLRGQ